MRNRFNRIFAVYSTYRHDGEHHVARISATIFISALISLDPVGLNGNAPAAIASIVAILAGFSFTALFSGYSHSVDGLSQPASESDRQDLVLLKSLLENFRIRSRYFLIISIICLFFVFLISVPLVIPEIIIKITFKECPVFYKAADILYSFGCFCSRMISLCLFFEILYTFYRLAETVFSILDVRRKYTEASN